MVGAGMSRNALPRRPGRAVMPTWWDLISALIDRLYPQGLGEDRRRSELLRQAGATSTALRLADEYVAAFGRSSLDELILATTPDHDFKPGRLHRMLVELPWADILTTNYDTLIERVAETGYGQRYTVIRTPSELPAGQRPRIVKLHGSFPSIRPFVFTEEDFRIYPQQAAPFVNLARQVVMENVLCLIGFSGDDPNFLAWTGWVRDQLADYTPQIYLCGLLTLTNSQRMLLQGRGVTPIDLTPLFPTEKYPEPGIRHSLSLEWFFLSLQEGRPYDPLEWPAPTPTSTPPNNQLPAVLRSSQTVPRTENWRPNDHTE